MSGASTFAGIQLLRHGDLSQTDLSISALFRRLQRSSRFNQPDTIVWYIEDWKPWIWVSGQDSLFLRFWTWGLPKVHSDVSQSAALDGNAKPDLQKVTLLQVVPCSELLRKLNLKRANSTAKLTSPLNERNKNTCETENHIARDSSLLAFLRMFA